MGMWRLSMGSEYAIECGRREVGIRSRLNGAYVDRADSRCAIPRNALFNAIATQSLWLESPNEQGTQRNCAAPCPALLLDFLAG